MIKIKVSNLSNGRYDYGFEGKASDLEIFEPYIGKFKTYLILSKFENQIILDSETEINANLICDRCVGDFQSIIKSKFRTVYLYMANYDDADNEKEDVVFIHPDRDNIDLDEYIRDYAVLAVPMKKLCKEDCKGLCPKCGKNLNEETCNCNEENIDPRWESIQKLKTKNN